MLARWGLSRSGNQVDMEGFKEERERERDKDGLHHEVGEM